jgi:hypothetical protein
MKSEGGQMLKSGLGVSQCTRISGRTYTTSPKTSLIFFEYFMYLGSLLRPEAKSKVPDWGIKSTLV